MKKSMFKRLMAAMLVLIMMLSLVACNNQPADPTKGNDPKPTQGNDPAPGTTAAPTEPALGLLDPYPETVTVTFSRLLDQATTYPEGITNDNNGYVKMAKDVLNIECVTKFEAKSGEDYDRLTSLAC